MVLSDRTIKEEIALGRIVIEPLDPGCIQPASVDVHLDRKLLIFRTWRHPFYIDVKQSLDDLSKCNFGGTKANIRREEWN